MKCALCGERLPTETWPDGTRVTPFRLVVGHFERAHPVEIAEARALPADRLLETVRMREQRPPPVELLS